MSALLFHVGLTLHFVFNSVHSHHRDKGGVEFDYIVEYPRRRIQWGKFFEEKKLSGFRFPDSRLVLIFFWAALRLNFCFVVSVMPLSQFSSPGSDPDPVWLKCETD